MMTLLITVHQKLVLALVFTVDCVTMLIVLQRYSHAPYVQKLNERIAIFQHSLLFRTNWNAGIRNGGEMR